MVNRLVVNGCSYMVYFATGGGHVDLAKKLGLDECISFAKQGSSNSRIIRTVLKDSFGSQPSLYVVGLTFLTRFEMPVRSGRDVFEGKWISFDSAGNANGPDKLDDLWNGSESKIYADLRNRGTVLGLNDMVENLMCLVLAMIHSVESRGHRILVFNTAESAINIKLHRDVLFALASTDSIIDQLKWLSIPWQFEQGARYLPEDENVDWKCRHVMPGDHNHLNRFLADYIKQHNILL